MKPAAHETRSSPPHAASADWLPNVPPQTTSLSNDRYTVRLSELGTGYSACQGVAVTRSMPDATCNADGFSIYLRDLDDGHLWSAGYQPTRTVAEHYEFQCQDGIALINRVDRGIECRLAICVSPQHDLEIRRCRLTNVSEKVRCIELTSYLEWVLGSPEADASHPAFSKLFVETSYYEERSAIPARRRPRHAEEQGLIGFHVVVLNSAARRAVRFETNRARFIGRGRLESARTEMTLTERWRRFATSIQ
jgi:cellobiose phosphorylase